MLIPSSLMRRIRFSSLRVSLNLITSPRLYLTEWELSRQKSQVLGICRNKQKRSLETVQNYKKGDFYEKSFVMDSRGFVHMGVQVCYLLAVRLSAMDFRENV